MSDFEHFNSLNNFRRYINIYIYFKKLKKIIEMVEPTSPQKKKIMVDEGGNKRQEISAEDIR